MRGSVDFIYIVTDSEWLKFRLTFEKDDVIVCESPCLKERTQGVFRAKSMNEQLFVNICILVLASRMIVGDFEFDRVRVIKQEVKS